jgi:hypothetical protein
MSSKVQTGPFWSGQHKKELACYLSNREKSNSEAHDGLIRKSQRTNSLEDINEKGELNNSVLRQISQIVPSPRIIN